MEPHRHTADEWRRWEADDYPQPFGIEPPSDSGHPTSEDWERITDRIAGWGPAVEPPFISEHYRRCDDPACPVAYAYRDPFPAVDHWHYVGCSACAAGDHDDCDNGYPDLGHVECKCEVCRAE